MATDTVRNLLPGLTEREYDWVRGELLRRAARDYEGVEQWTAAAGCWAELGEHARAGGLYAKGGDRAAAAQALRAAGRYAEAAKTYRAWEAELPAGDDVNRVTALLGRVSCHVLGAREGLSAAAGREAYRAARGVIAAEGERSGWVTARCWAALGEYGAAVGRYDLVQEGFERAVGEPTERARAGRAYLAVVRARGDRLLAQSLEVRLAEWDVPDAPPEDHAERLRRLKEQVLREKGEWVRKFGVDPTGEEPAVFRHYFIVIDPGSTGSGFIGRGAVVVGESWDRDEIPGWRVVHGFVKKGTGHLGIYSWYSEMFLVSYLGPDWDPTYAELSDQLHAEKGQVLDTFVRHP